MKYRVTVEFSYQERHFDFEDIRDANGFLKDVSLRIIDKESDDRAYMLIVNEEEEEAEE